MQGLPYSKMFTLFLTKSTLGRNIFDDFYASLLQCILISSNIDPHIFTKTVSNIEWISSLNKVEYKAGPSCYQPIIINSSLTFSLEHVIMIMCVKWCCFLSSLSLVALHACFVHTVKSIFYVHLLIHLASCWGPDSSARFSDFGANLDTFAWM